MADEENDWVEMRHPKLGDDSRAPHGGNARVSREAFDTVWAPIGWEMVEPAETAKARRSPAAPASTAKESA